MPWPIDNQGAWLENDSSCPCNRDDTTKLSRMTGHALCIVCEIIPRMTEGAQLLRDAEAHSFAEEKRKKDEKAGIRTTDALSRCVVILKGRRDIERGKAERDIREEQKEYDAKDNSRQRMLKLYEKNSVWSLYLKIDDRMHWFLYLRSAGTIVLQAIPTVRMPSKNLILFLAKIHFVQKGYAGYGFLRHHGFVASFREN